MLEQRILRTVKQNVLQQIPKNPGNTSQKKRKQSFYIHAHEVSTTDNTLKLGLLNRGF